MIPIETEAAGAETAADAEETITGARKLAESPPRTDPEY